MDCRASAPARPGAATSRLSAHTAPSRARPDGVEAVGSFVSSSETAETFVEDRFLTDSSRAATLSAARSRASAGASPARAAAPLATHAEVTPSLETS